MTKETLDFALSVLSKQDAHTREAYAAKEPAVSRAAQEAYTDGIRAALEIVLTEGYTLPIPDEYKPFFARRRYHV